MDACATPDNRLDRLRPAEICAAMARAPIAWTQSPARTCPRIGAGPNSFYLRRQQTAELRKPIAVAAGQHDVELTVQLPARRSTATSSRSISVTS